MTRQIALGDRTIEYTLNLSRRTRRIRISAYPGGEIKVSIPAAMPVDAAESFMRKKAKWILAKHDYLRQFKPQAAGGNAAEYRAYKGRALQLALDRLEHFNRIYGFKFGKVSIKNHKSLWGSCSRRGNLNFNYKIALISPQACDYIIVHELCHLKEFNHSPRFWNLVAQTVPNYRQIRAELKKSGLNME